jgi:aerobic carbon-monoxide dehydrogenase large subunit
MKQFGVGQPVRRVEDRRFITGRGTYVDDISRPRQAHAHMLRSPHAHARIAAIELSEALSAPGVLAVLTGEDLARDGIGGISCLSAVTNRDQSPSAMPPYPAIARGRVRHVGDTVAMVVAESAAAARDAAELIAVDYEPLPAVVETAHTLDPGQAQVWDEAKGNLCFDWEIGDAAAVERALAGARHRIDSRRVRSN